MSKHNGRPKRIQYHPACRLFPEMGEDELRELADDIKANGLQNPIVTLDGKVLDGRNRYKACKLAGVVPSFTEWTGDNPVVWVVSQNLVRRHLTSSQRAVIAHDLLPMLEKQAKDRQRLSNGRGKKVGKKSPTNSANGKATEVAARITRSNSKYVQAVKSLSQTAPELVKRVRAGELTVLDAQRMARAESDSGLTSDQRNILRAATRIRQQQTAERNRQQIADERKATRCKSGRRLWTLTTNQRVVKCTAVIADPPYGITTEPWEPEDLESFTCDWCSRWSKSGADFIAVFWSQARLFDGQAWFDESLNGYDFQQILIWHASNNVSCKTRQRFKESWEPIFVYRRKGCSRLVFPNGKQWTKNLHNLDCHVAPVPQSNFTGEDLKQHPAQKPVSVMRWLIHALTEPGEKIASPFCGSAPCGIAAAQLGRRYHGIDSDRGFLKIAEGRIAAYGGA